MARVEAEAGQLGEELPRRGAFFTLSASLADSGSVSVPSEATLQRKGLPGLAVWWFGRFPFSRIQCLAWCGVSFEIKLFLLKSSEQPPAPPFGTFRNTVPARTVRNVPGEREA